MLIAGVFPAFRLPTVCTKPMSLLIMPVACDWTGDDSFIQIMYDVILCAHGRQGPTRPRSGGCHSIGSWALEVLHSASVNKARVTWVYACSCMSSRYRSEQRTESFFPASIMT